MPQYRINRTCTVRETDTFPVEADSPEDVRARFAEFLKAANEDGVTEIVDTVEIDDGKDAVEVCPIDPCDFRALLKFNPVVPADDYWAKRLANTPVPDGKRRARFTVELVLDVDEELLVDPDMLAIIATGIEGLLQRKEAPEDCWLTRDVTVHPG